MFTIPAVIVAGAVFFALQRLDVLPVIRVALVIFIVWAIASWFIP